MEKAYLFVSKSKYKKNKIYPVRFDNRDQWTVVDNLADATFFSSIKEAEKKKEYAPYCYIAEVSLSVL